MPRIIRLPQLLVLAALAGPVLAQQPQANQMVPRPPVPPSNTLGPAPAPAAPMVNPGPAVTSNPAAPSAMQVVPAPAAAPQVPSAASTTVPPRAAAPVQPPPPAYVPPPPPPVRRAPLPAAPPSPPVSGLPPDAPKLVINGGTYSEQPELRMVIVNGQVAREGADLGSGVVLQQIRPSSVVLAFKGAQYNIRY